MRMASTERVGRKHWLTRLNRLHLELTCVPSASIVTATLSFLKHEDTNDYGRLKSAWKNRAGAGRGESLVHCLRYCTSVTRTRRAPGSHLSERTHWGRGSQAHQRLGKRPLSPLRTHG